MPTKCKKNFIDRLTDAQIARFPEFIKRWTDIGLSTKPADREQAERGVRMAYECAGLAPPKAIVWCGSPFSQGLTRAIVFGLANGEIKSEIGEAVEKKVGDSVGDSVGASVGASVRASVGDSVWASVWDSVGASVRASVWDSVGASVGASVRASVRASVGDSVRASVWASWYGQHDAGWLAFYDYFRDAAGLSEETQKLAGLWLLSQSAGWWLPHQNLCWVSERHNVLHRDADGRLHCDNGPALQYPDGWSIYAIGGVRVDEQTIMRPETQTLEQIEKEENAEVRRVRIERFGWPRYLAESGAKVANRRRNDRDGQEEALYALKDKTKRFVCVDPSTGRKYALGVPAEIKNCDEAQNWMSHGLDRFAVHRS